MLPLIFAAVMWWDTLPPPTTPVPILQATLCLYPDGTRIPGCDGYDHIGQSPMDWPEWADSVWRTPDGNVTRNMVYLNSAGAWQYGVVLLSEGRRLVRLWFPGPARVYDPCNYLPEIADSLPGYPVPPGWTPEDCQQ